MKSFLILTFLSLSLIGCTPEPTTSSSYTETHTVIPSTINGQTIGNFQSSAGSTSTRMECLGKKCKVTECFADGSCKERAL